MTHATVPEVTRSGDAGVNNLAPGLSDQPSSKGERGLNEDCLLKRRANLSRRCRLPHGFNAGPYSVDQTIHTESKLSISNNCSLHRDGLPGGRQVARIQQPAEAETCPEGEVMG